MTFESKTLLLLEGERRLLANIADRVPLAEAFDELMRTVEARSEVEMPASILLLDKDGKHLPHGAAPSRPKAYNDAIHGAQIGPTWDWHVLSDKVCCDGRLAALFSIDPRKGVVTSMWPKPWSTATARKPR